MRVCFRTVALLFAVASLICAQANANTVLALKVTASPNPVTVSNSLTYTFAMTNISGVGLQSVVVTNFWTQLVQFTDTNSVVTNINLFIGGVGTLTNGQSIVETLTVVPLSTGTLTNFIFVSTNTIIATTNVTVSVVAPFVTNVDLSVTVSNFSVIGYPSDIFANDRVTYSVTVSNAGPASAKNVSLTNTLPTGIKLLSVSPTNQSFTVSGTNVIMNLGTVTNHTARTIQLTVQPTNSGTFTISEAVGATTNNPDLNPADNFLSTNLTVLDFLAGTSNLVAYIGSSQVTNRQSGFLEQIIVLSNAGPSQIAAARVIVSGLTNYLLVNATGTNNGSPFVVEGASLDPSASVNLLFRFFPRTAFPFSNSQLQAVEVTPPDFTLPANLSGITNTPYLIRTNLPLGQGILVEFPALTNHIYTVAYSDNLTNWLAAQPSFKANANYILWIDYGPPETLSNSPARFYKIYLNP